MCFMRTQTYIYLYCRLCWVTSISSIGKYRYLFNQLVIVTRVIKALNVMIRVRHLFEMFVERACSVVNVDTRGLKWKKNVVHKGKHYWKVITGKVKSPSLSLVMHSSKYLDLFHRSVSSLGGYISRNDLLLGYFWKICYQRYTSNWSELSRPYSFLTK